ncbi:helix-turn-helix domain-containing protein [Dactylosporangium fulvum]|uniref:Helix-turn-helix domain-containing protein n=1 Tax=Dactylosporangium fulvum TaxID=53359 RepID=A0ABY5W173_9ACTN|nr:helix-turn-helix domain-containing protein [Dactylosporangium fulvum]UWP82799.1 helix-turn-helix domain-containing protein [Dactylosporangium fulvum]
MSPGPGHDSQNAGARFAATLRARRLARGLTQEELASRTGLGVRTLRELERGRVARPQRNTVSLLAEALSLSGPDRDDFVASAGGRGGPSGVSDHPWGRPHPRSIPGLPAGGPGQIFPDQALPGRDAQGRDTSGQSIPGQAVPGSGVPRRAGPVGGVQDRATPGSGVPGRAAPGSGTRGGAAPGDGVRERTMPGGGAPGPGTSDGGASGRAMPGGVPEQIVAGGVRGRAVPDTDAPNGSGVPGGEVLGTGVLGSGGPPTGRVSGRGVPARAAAGSTAGEVTPTLPLPTHPPLVGRDADVAELLTLLGGPYGAELIALVGLAGIGKTGLAHAVAQRVAAAGATAVSVTITNVSRPTDIFAAVAAVFGVARAEELVDRYAGRPALLVLDGIDRSPRAAVEAMHWLRSRVPAVRILATSRRPLAGEVPGAVDWRVEPLDLPPPGPYADPAALRRVPSVALFLDRLRQVRREPVADQEVGAVAELVRRLDGLPLAIELAAARGRVLELPELLSRYGHRVLDLAPTDAGGRRLRDAVAASYHLLDEREQAALRRLSVFRGRWSLELAEALLDDTVDVEAILDRLVGLGLVSVRGPGDLRFRLLDVVMDFAAEQCANHSELRDTRLRHAEVVTRVAVRISAEFTGPGSALAVSRLDYLNSDIRSALRYTSVRDPAIALRLAGAIPRWCRLRGRDVEAHRLLRRLLDDRRAQDCDPLVRAVAQVGAAMLASAHGRGVVELCATEAALEVLVACGDTSAELTARALLAGIWQAVGGAEESRRHLETMLGLAIRTGRVREIGVAQNNLAWHDIRTGDLATAARRLTAAGRRAVEAGDARIRALTQANLAEVARLDGRFDDAVDLGRRAAATIAEIGDPTHRVRALGTLGQALAESGRPDDAADVLVELAEMPGGAGMSDMITAYLAVGRGDRTAAARAFESAANLLAGRDDIRDVLEALTGLAACGEPEVRRRALDELNGIRERGGLALLPRERALLGERPLPETARTKAPGAR